MKERILIECSCGHAFMAVMDAGDGELILTLYDYYKPSIWQRFKNACSYFWTGRLESDELLLDKDTSIKLRDYLNEIYK